MLTPKTLVIGSTRHQHVTCVSWEEISSVNLVDFDLVVVNVRSLTDELIIQNAQRPDFDIARAAFARLLTSGGEIVVLGAQPRHHKVNSRTFTNYGWSPINIGIAEEKGTTIEIKDKVFQNFLSRLEKWQFYYFMPREPITIELLQICGDLGSYEYKQNLELYVVNRYYKMLGGSLSFSVVHRLTDDDLQLGRLIILPLIEELEEREAVNLVLQDLLSLPQSTLPPERVEHVPMPLIPEIQATICEKKAAIAALNREIVREEEKKQKLGKV